MDEPSPTPDINPTPDTPDNSQSIYPTPSAGTFSAPPSDLTHPTPQHDTPPHGQVGKSNAIEIVLQWVSYGLWEWALITLATLLTTALSYFFDNGANSSADYTFSIYVLAAMVILLPFAYVVNNIYSKREPAQKHGFAAVVMVLNAVGVFLATVGALIFLVISILNIFISTSSNTGTKIAIFSSLIVATLGGMLFVRIINIPKFAKFIQWFPKIVLVIAGVSVVLVIAGPFRSSITSKHDRVIEDNISSLTTSIQNYVSANSKLPNSLQDVDTTTYPGVKTLISQNLVTYQPEGPSVTANFSYTDTTSSTTTFNYQLCVTYQKKKGTGLAPSANSGAGSTSYIDAFNHPAGKQCYSQTTY